MIMRQPRHLNSRLLAWCFATLFWAQALRAAAGAGSLSATKSGDAIVVESAGGTVTYKAIVNAKQGGNITEVRLPADGDVIARELNDIFFLGAHGEQFTLRGWTGKSRFNISCSVDMVSQR